MALSNNLSPKTCFLSAAAEEQPPAVPAAKSDAVAEAALAVLAALMARTRPQGREQLTSLLPRLLRIASLPRSAAAEEVRFHKGVQVPWKSCAHWRGWCTFYVPARLWSLRGVFVTMLYSVHLTSQDTGNCVKGWELKAGLCFHSPSV